MQYVVKATEHIRPTYNGRTNVRRVRSRVGFNRRPFETNNCAAIEILETLTIDRKLHQMREKPFGPIRPVVKHPVRTKRNAGSMGGGS